jgi:hypothetical protein
MNDNDLQILESYLDGDMSPVQSEELWKRLAMERELAAELEKLRGEHALRQGVWTSLEPAEHTAAQLEYSIVRGARRQEVFAMVSKGMGILTTVAACILMGFTIGWLGHDRYNPGTGAVPTDSHGNVGNVSNVSDVRVVSPNSNSAAPGIVDIRDSSGRVIAQQQFSSRDEAESFVRDFQNAQANRRDISQPMITPTDVKF